MGDNRDHNWTDERVELVKRLWQDGLSASQIAKELRGVTRNAVIGKAHRLGLTANAGKYRQSASAPHATRPAHKAAPVAREPKGLTKSKTPDSGRGAMRTPSPVPVLKIAGRGTVFEEAASLPPRALPGAEAFTPLPNVDPVPFIERRGAACAWPVGGHGADMLCCGASALAGPYCPTHAKRAYASHAARDWVDKRIAMPTRAQRAA